MTEESVWVSLQVSWQDETREFRGVIQSADLHAILKTGRPADSLFLKVTNTYVVEYNEEGEPEVLKYGGAHDLYRSSTGECYFRADSILYFDILKDGAEYFLDSM